MTNQDIESVHRMVEKVKRKREVGINDMKSWEREALAKEEGREEGQERVNEWIVRLSEAGRTDIIYAFLRTLQQSALASLQNPEMNCYL